MSHKSLSRQAGAGQSIKRMIDIVLAGGGLILLSPVFVMVMVLILMSMGRPIFFRQTRPGHHAVPFDLIKFRTMRTARDASGSPLPDADRLTGVGRFLRRTSLDELPQLWNVLNGDMSLVGPRPLLMEYLERYSPEQMRRHDVKPGITGLAQISGRNALDWDARFALDVWYADHWSLWLDVRILAGTVRKVLTGEGISAQGVPTMTRFGEDSEVQP